ncbi:MAG: bifunctional oligoribonuclease/PAP phosphatase NrnA [Spirochaetaceae bacterium]|jgi:phosphoesterase RecJ-like protein|nr:bifunctional oligoribonuclease/PAP phosphatase NrnA [Spirochaetaceae bacterium]
MFIPSAPPAELATFIKKYTRFLVVGHKEPDGDCIGSELVLCSALRRLGKTAIPCSAGPFKRHEIRAYEELFQREITAEMRKDAALIIVDCSSADRTGDLESHLSGLPTAIIDHHITGTAGAADARFVNSESPSTVSLIYEFVKALGLEPTREEAELLFLGLCGDTGFFRHLDAGGAATFDLAATLVRAGANPKQTFALMNGGKTLNTCMFLGSMLSRIESYFEGKLLICTETFEETERYGVESRDSDTLYQLLLSVNNVEAIAVIRQESAEKCNVGLRSRNRVNVALIAATLGGGGHKNAAGLGTHGTISELRTKLLAEFEKILTTTSDE